MLKTKPFRLQNNLTCDLSPSLFNRHVLRDPRKLPCNRTACYLCIEALANSKSQLECPVCLQRHNLRDLSRNMMCEYALDENIFSLYSFFQNDLKKSCERIKIVGAEKKKTLLNVINFIDIDLMVRVESILIELEKLHIVLEERAKEAITKNFDIAGSQFDECKKNIENRSKISLTKADSIYLIEKICYKLSKLNHNITSRKPGCKKSFKSIKAAEIIGDLHWIDKNRFYIRKLDSGTFKPKLIRLEKFHPYDVCSYINGTFLFSDPHNNCIYEMNRKLNKVVSRLEKISKGENKKLLIRPTTLCSDLKKKIVFICCASDKQDLLSKEVLMIHINLKEILNIIKVDNSIDCLSEFIYYNEKNNCLYIFDSKLKASSIKQVNLTNQGAFETKSYLDLNKESSLSEPYCASFADDYLAINFNNRLICIYEIATGQFDSSIRFDTEHGQKIFSIYLENETGKLFVHLNNGIEDNLLCFQKIQKSAQWNQIFQSPFLDLNSGSWKMKLIDECLFLTMWSQYLVII